MSKRKAENQAKEGAYSALTAKTMRIFLPNILDINAFINTSPFVAVCQLVSRHIRLNDFVCRNLGLVQSLMCSCLKDKETVIYFLFECTLYDEIRREIWPDFQPEYSFITKDWKKMQEFVEKTGRFEGSVMKSNNERKIDLDKDDW